MLLTIDVGNTQTVIGLYDADASSEGEGAERGLVQHWRVSTVHERTSDELAVLLQGFLVSSPVRSLGNISGLSICSGVPRILANLRQLAERYLEVPAVVIEPGLKTGMPILYDNPREVGADRIANAIAAYDLFGGPTVVVDFGTGNNFDVISGRGEFLGGAIAPGIEVSLDALFGRAAALGAIEIVEPRSVIGKSTVESMQSGAVYGFTDMIDGMCRRFQAELGEATFVATGGLAHVIAPVSKMLEHVEPFLTLHGLRLVHERNANR